MYYVLSLLPSQLEVHKEVNVRTGGLAPAGASHWVQSLVLKKKMTH
jgi:hypothetical protein